MTASSASTPFGRGSLAHFFDRIYLYLCQGLLLLSIWFACFAQAAHDLWSSAVLFTLIGLSASFLLLGHLRANRTLFLPSLTPLACFLAAIVVSLPGSMDVMVSLHEWWIWFYCGIAYYVLCNTILWTQNTEKLLLAISIVLLPLFIACLPDAVRPGDVHGPLVSSIVLSGFLLFWPFILWELNSQKILRYALLASFIGLLLLARSAWAYASLCVGGYFFAKARHGRTGLFKKNRGITAPLVVACILIGLIAVKSLHSVKAFNDFTNRILWWQSAWDMLRAHPLLGVGPGAYAIALQHFRVPGTLGSLFAHGFLIQMLAETGLLGFCALMWFVISLVRDVRQSSTLTPLKYQVPLVAGLIAVLFFSLINFNLEFFLNRLMLFCAIAMLVSPQTGFRVESRWAKAVLALGLLALIPVAQRPWQSSRYVEQGHQLEREYAWDNAIPVYEKALDILPVNAEAHAGLVRVYTQIDRETNSGAHADQIEFHRRQALRWKQSAAPIDTLWSRQYVP